MEQSLMLLGRTVASKSSVTKDRRSLHRLDVITGQRLKGRKGPRSANEEEHRTGLCQRTYDDRIIALWALLLTAYRLRGRRRGRRLLTATTAHIIHSPRSFPWRDRSLLSYTPVHVPSHATQPSTGEQWSADTQRSAPAPDHPRPWPSCAAPRTRPR